MCLVGPHIPVCFRSRFLGPTSIVLLRSIRKSMTDRNEFTLRRLLFVGHAPAPRATTTVNIISVSVD